MSRINFVLSWVEHGKMFYNLGAWFLSLFSHYIFVTFVIFLIGENITEVGWSMYQEVSIQDSAGNHQYNQLFLQDEWTQ